MITCEIFAELQSLEVAGLVKSAGKSLRSGQLQYTTIDHWNLHMEKLHSYIIQAPSNPVILRQPWFPKHKPFLSVQSSGLIWTNRSVNHWYKPTLLEAATVEITPLSTIHLEYSDLSWAFSNLKPVRFLHINPVTVPSSYFLVSCHLKVNSWKHTLSKPPMFGQTSSNVLVLWF